MARHGAREQSIRTHLLERPAQQHLRRADTMVRCRTEHRGMLK